MLGFHGGSDSKVSRETQVWSLGWEDPLKKGMATHYSILAWRISWTEESGRLPSMGSQSQTQLSGFHFTYVNNQDNSADFLKYVSELAYNPYVTILLGF